MKMFLIPLGTDYGNDHHVYPHVHGPFQHRLEVDEYLSKSFRTEPKAKFLLVEGEIIGVPKNPLEKPDEQKRAPGNFDNYTESPTGSQKYICNDCKQPIMNATVAHPIHLKGTGGGFGECKYENVPYCPNCEHKPNYNGSPIEV